MSRRHFVQHLAGGAAMALPAISLTDALAANSTELKKKHKAAIMLWMGGGPATIDIWDLKPGAPTGGPFRPISTNGDLQICEHMPLMAQQMKHMSVIRSMSTREADHARGRYYMHTGYVPNPNIEYPGYGSVISHELYSAESGLEIPPFVAVGGGSVGPGFLGMTYAPFVVGSDGNVRNLQMDMPEDRLMERMAMLEQIETSFIGQVSPEGMKKPRPRQGQWYGCRSCPRPQENPGPHDQQADGRFQNLEESGHRARSLRQDGLRPWLPHGSAVGRARRVVRRSRFRRGGTPTWTISSRSAPASCPNWTRP